MTGYLAQSGDVAARLADGRSAVEDAHTYVSAARQRGYSNPELTDLGSWYDTERGLDLQRLDADEAALETAARAATEAVGLARAALAALMRAWNGPGAHASAEFVRRHCDSAAAVADALTLAAQTCAALRADLWRAVDAKVAATTAIAERVGTRRESWLSAAQAVLAGTPDDAAADIVDTQVAPFVATALANDWLRDMRTTTESAREAYRRAVDVLGHWRGAQFEVPGDLGPRPVVAQSQLVSTAAPQEAFQGPAPAGLPAPPTPLPTLPQAAPLAGPAALPQAAPLPGVSDPMPVPPTALPGPGPLPGPAPLPDLGAAAAVPGRIAESLGGLLGAPGAGMSDLGGGGSDIDPPELGALDPPELDALDPLEPDEPEEMPDEEADEPTDTGAEETEGEAESGEEPEPAPEPAATEVDPVGTPPEPEPDPDCEQSTPAPAPAPPPPPVPEPTPCEMAADELPQAGE